MCVVLGFIHRKKKEEKKYRAIKLFYVSIFNICARQAMRRRKPKSENKLL